MQALSTDDFSMRELTSEEVVLVSGGLTKTTFWLWAGTALIGAVAIVAFAPATMIVAAGVLASALVGVTAFALASQAIDDYVLNNPGTTVTQTCETC
jgi:hypothetical protein